MVFAMRVEVTGADLRHRGIEAEAEAVTRSPKRRRTCYFWTKFEGRKSLVYRSSDAVQPLTYLFHAYAFT